MYNFNYDDNNYLMHYGVIGMRWGVRRAGRLSRKAGRMRTSAKELQDIADYKMSKGKTKAANKAYAKVAKEREQADALAAKSREIQKKHEDRSGGKAAYSYNARQSSGKIVAKSLVLGTYGALRYNEVRAKGGTRGEAAIAGILTGTANRATGGVVGIVEPRLRQDKYKNKAKKAIGSAKRTIQGS